MKFIYDDGGRQAAGYRGKAGDCAVRAISIATKQPYQQVYNALGKLAPRKRKGHRGKSPRNGVAKATTRKYLASIGWTWHPCMSIGSGCKVHLRADELPSGRIIAAVSRHITAIIDGVIHDTYDPSREGTRCVYGYWTC